MIGSVPGSAAAITGAGAAAKNPQIDTESSIPCVHIGASFLECGSPVEPGRLPHES
jgi:hypothetical protein